MQSLCVFCASNLGHRPSYAQAARRVGALIAKEGARLIYGGAQVGLMGEVARAVLDAGGEVVGVLPRMLERREVAHLGLTELRLVDSMHERKQIMFELADGFLTLAGGFGTLDEMCEILTWAQLGLHQKPIGLLNTDGFYDHFIDHLHRSQSEGLLRSEHREMLQIGSTPEEVWSLMGAYRAPSLEKWLSLPAQA